MRAKIVILGLLAACGYGAYRHYTAGPSAAKALEYVSPAAARYASADIGVIDPDTDLAAWRVPGHITVFAFVSDNCSACVQTKRYLRDHLRRRPDAAVRLIDLGRNWRNVDGMARYAQDIRSIPHVVVYAADGTLLAADRGRNKEGLDALFEWMNHERDKARQ